ncbi:MULTISPECIES: AMP-binding protein [unclassified Bradyrhizobium]|uniref:AMP-binding protein n=1 Tax=unclassified Bradyrhizobium TaxID=2631580 RepID=UPI00247A4E3E|nr:MULTISPECIES: AMP-binding protein [unclassified Bradyrhizobium]WGS18832.1 AMP-binding protein [Bradyrhizobium sp. ISRA463]WGS25660.1 AMP-binding protein [Bradyrhizobium sp. ISRA464]
MQATSSTAEATWKDPRILPPEVCVLRHVLDRNAAEAPDKVFVHFDDGHEWTYARIHTTVRRTAAALQRMGVAQGDHVLTWLPNSPDALRIWFAINYIGAVYVPMNIAWRGQVLENAVRISGARLLISHAELADRLHDIDRCALTDLLLIGPDVHDKRLSGFWHHDAADLSAPGEPDALQRPIMPWDNQMIIYTSGTTGPSKGVLCTYMHCGSSALAFSPLTADDRNLVNLPLFHMSGTGAVYRMLVKGGSIALVESFDTRSFWDTVRRTRSTYLTLLGAMVPFLLKEPPGPRDRDHTLRVVNIVPLADGFRQFGERFGVEVYTVFNMTETSWPIISERDPETLGTCGRPRPGVFARVVDENDVEVTPGKTGELILRTDAPWAMSHGYYGNPEATARAWRNGWFHTGDAFRQNERGEFFFVDRMKDAIRRRGENISSFEVEAAINGHPDIREVAVVGVPSEFGEDEVLAVVAPVEGRSVDAAALLEWLRPRLAHFMIPRYIRIMPELPKTPTQKVQKHLLRADGVASDTWDREAAGLKVRREKLASLGGAGEISR